ncbi:MAG: acylphosphatase [Planctomycetota bacterium]|jgi:acylphosphatase
MGERAHLLISGRVQGVWYRASCREAAEMIGVAGWVRNLMDGRVEAVAEGEKGKIEEFIRWCRKGPPGSRVADVEVAWEDPEGLSGVFRVVY